MKVWTFTGNGCETGFVDMTIGERVTVFRCSSGLTTFGEPAILTRATAQHLVFTTDSGAIVKTKVDNLFATIGKAEKAGYSVTRRPFENFDHMIRENVRFWNSKKCCFEYK